MTLRSVVRERDQQSRWTDLHELSAITADRLGVLASGQVYKSPVDRLRRPHDPDPVQTMGWAGFARFLSTGGAG